METNRNDLTRSTAEKQANGVMERHIDLELALAYAANSEMSVEIMEEFTVVDQEGF